MVSPHPSVNRIPETQNEPQQVRHLAAQRHLYRVAKRILATQAILAGPAPLAWSVAVAFVPAVQAGAALWGLLAVLLDAVVLDRWQQSLTRRAAQIQELFDCSVLELEWNRLVAGDAPDPETVDRAARRNGDDEPTAPLPDWYPAVAGGAPLHLGRLVCQRSNLRWEADVHRSYLYWLGAILSVVAGIVFLISFVGDLTLRKFVLGVLSPLAPAILFGIRQCYAHKDARARVDRLKRYWQDAWDRGRSGTLRAEDLTRESRRLQDALFQHRATAPLIFEWVYRRLRPARQREMEVGAEELVRQITSSRSS